MSVNKENFKIKRGKGFKYGSHLRSTILEEYERLAKEGLSYRQLMDRLIPVHKVSERTINRIRKLGTKSPTKKRKRSPKYKSTKKDEQIVDIMIEDFYENKTVPTFEDLYRSFKNRSSKLSFKGCRRSTFLKILKKWDTEGNVLQRSSDALYVDWVSALSSPSEYTESTTNCDFSNQPITTTTILRVLNE